MVRRRRTKRREIIGSLVYCDLPYWISWGELVTHHVFAIRCVLPNIKLLSLREHVLAFKYTESVAWPQDPVAVCASEIILTALSQKDAHQYKLERMICCNLCLTAGSYHMIQADRLAWDWAVWKWGLAQLYCIQDCVTSLNCWMATPTVISVQASSSQLCRTKTIPCHSVLKRMATAGWQILALSGLHCYGLHPILRVTLCQFCQVQYSALLMSSNKMKIMFSMVMYMDFMRETHQSTVWSDLIRHTGLCTSSLDCWPSRLSSCLTCWASAFEPNKCLNLSAWNAFLSETKMLLLETAVG